MGRIPVLGKPLNKIVIDAKKNNKNEKQKEARRWAFPAYSDTNTIIPTFQKRNAGANINATDMYGRTAAQSAARKGLGDMVSYLQSRGGR